MTIVQMQMNIDCDGCEDKVKKALLRLQGVHDVHVDRVRGKVTATGSASEKKVLRAARRTGRLAVLWPSAADHHQHHAFYAQPQPAYHHDQHHRQYSSLHLHSKKSGYPEASSYNYRVHGYYDSDLHGHGYRHEHDQVSAAGSYFSDDNPHACAVM